MTLQSFMKQEALQTPALLRREAAHWEAQATTLRAQAASRTSAGGADWPGQLRQCLHLCFLFDDAQNRASPR